MKYGSHHINQLLPKYLSTKTLKGS